MGIERTVLHHKIESCVSGRITYVGSTLTVFTATALCHHFRSGRSGGEGVRCACCELAGLDYGFWRQAERDIDNIR